VKPTNIVFIRGEPCLGDYGLVGEPGSAVDFSGTEGFQPLEGTNDTAADLFALGKTIYEAWSANDRLEFPSLPRTVLDAEDWDRYGKLLNAVILRACNAEPGKRFRSAEELVEALLGVLSGRRPMKRRRWLLVAGGGACLTGAAALIFKGFSAPASVHWRQIRQRGFNVELWEGHAGTVDWLRRRILSVAIDGTESVFESVDLDSFKVMVSPLRDGPKKVASSILHPEKRKLWAIEGGRGEVFEVDPETLAVRRLGGGPDTRCHYSASTYWNPVMRRVGVFGGYGNLAVRNDRSEFDSNSGTWVQIEPDRPNSGPWRRIAIVPLAADVDGRRIFLVGGRGSPSGKQGDLVKGLRAFDSQFHFLDDIWELDLTKNSWRQLLPLGHLDARRLKAAVYLPNIKGLLLFHGMALGDQPGGAVVKLLRPGVDQKPLDLPMKGPGSRMSRIWVAVADPKSEEVLLLAEDGVFRLSVLLP
jgi:hypothetical protein